MKVKVKRSGYLFIAITIFLGIASANTANNLLYIIVSGMLSFMLVSGIVSIINLTGIKVKLKPPLEVFAGRTAYFDVSLHKENRIPSFLIEVISEKGLTLFPFVFQRSSTKKLPFVFPKRGKVDEIEVKISSDFPAGLFSRYMKIKVKTNVIVFPEPKPVRLKELFTAEAKNKGESSKARTKGLDEITGIRDYEGDPVKLIHWKLSAKKDKLIVKDTVSQEDTPVVLSLDMVKGTKEEKISKLTFLIIKLINEGYAVGLKIKDTEIPPSKGETHKLKLLTELALL